MNTDLDELRPNSSILSLSSLFSQPSLCFVRLLLLFSALGKAIASFPSSPSHANQLHRRTASHRSLFLWRLVRRGEFGEDLWTVETEREREGGRQGKGAAGRKGKERKGKDRQGNATQRREGKGMAMAGRSVQERGLQLLENVVMTPAGANAFFFVFFFLLRSPAGSCGCGGYL
jgi:hypothetical protein